MDTNLALLLLLSPLLGFLINIFFGKTIGKTASGIIGTLTVAISFAVSILFFIQINKNQLPVSIVLFDWIQISHFKIDFGFLLVIFERN